MSSNKDDLLEENKRGRGRPKKNGGHDRRVDVRLSPSEWDMLTELEDDYFSNKKSRAEIMRAALRAYYTLK